jgi:hypothetical protein
MLEALYECYGWELDYYTDDFYGEEVLADYQGYVECQFHTLMEYSEVVSAVTEVRADAD